MPVIWVYNQPSVSAKKKIEKGKLQKSPENMVATAKPEQAKTGNKIAEHKKRTGISQHLLPGSWKINAGIFLLLIIATVVFYSGDLHLGFFSVDDPGYISDNPWIRSIRAENIGHILGNPYFANYSLLHLFSYMPDYSVAGPNAYIFHLSGNSLAGILAGFVFGRVFNIVI